MKSQIIKLINFIETKRESNPKLFKILYYSLWVVFIEEMVCIKLGIFGYKKYKQYSLRKEIREAAR